MDETFRSDMAAGYDLGDACLVLGRRTLRTVFGTVFGKK